MSATGVENMSVKDMERAIVEILTDNGMSDKQARTTVKNMSTKDMVKYLVEARS